MKIILDAMGGDNAPREIVRGALLAQKESEADTVLVGRGEDILHVLKEEGLDTLPRGMEIAHAEQVITMDDNPSNVIKEKPDSSIVVGLDLLNKGVGDAFVSAGNTGALLSGATLIVKRIKGVRRAALSPIIPTAKGGAMLIDCGANVECTPEYLLQFAFMGSLYASCVMGIDKPRVGLMNIGAEETKGDALRKETYKLLRQAHDDGRLLFVGNLEGRDIAFGLADVVVSDGFSGNIMLKTTEGMGLFFASLMKQMFTKNIIAKMGALFVRGGLRSLKKMLDYTEYGGSPFLGVGKPVIKTHGSSNANAIRSTIRQARDFAASQVIQEIANNMEHMRLPDQGGGTG
ncbi:MAG: phosphate acyltransferase PlsX [Oscillospiraceae bacterium]|nr:phosphate acyltransferase PlsX [Oscillospiraceae bacterium]